MPPTNHALLGASSAHRWLNCPGSAKLTENMPDSTSPYAEAGHLAHEIAELKARNYFIETLPKRSFNAKLKKLKESEHYDKSMDSATDEYLEHLKARAMSYPTAPTVALEVQVDFSGLNILDISSPMEKENISLSNPPIMLLSIMDQPTPRCPKPERLPMANAASPAPAAHTRTASHLVDSFLMNRA